MPLAANDAIFVDEYSPGDDHHWSNVPDSLWWNLVQGMKMLNVNGIGFQGVSARKALSESTALRAAARPRFPARYTPYHSTPNPQIIVIDFDERIERLLCSEPFDQWNRANDSLPFDELLFFVDETVKIQTCTYKNMIFFCGITNDEISTLGVIDPRLLDGLYTSEMKKCCHNRNNCLSAPIARAIDRSGRSGAA
jgi:hypothetical protein